MLYVHFGKLQIVRKRLIFILCKMVLSTVFIYLFSIQSLVGQEQIGLRLGNYAGSWSTTLNPANSAYFEGRWDVGLGAISLFANNNILFLKNTSAIQAVLNANQIRTFSSEIGAQDSKSPSIKGIYNLNQQSNFGQFLARVDGPSFLFKLNKTFTIGLSTSFRTNLKVQNIPPDLNNLPLASSSPIYEKLPTLKGSAMAWSEIAPHISYHQTADYDFAIGVTPKLLIGHESAYLKSNDLAIKFSKDSTPYYAGDLSFGLTQGNLTAQHASLKVSGMGGGLDIGFAFGVQQYSKSDLPQYIWKAGIAIIDLGIIRFNKNASNYNVPIENNQRAGTSEGGKDIEVNSINTFKQRFTNDSSEAFRGANYYLFTPAAVTANFDYQVLKDFHVGVYLIQKIAFGSRSIKRPSSFTIAPQYEKKWYAIGTSVSMVEWQSIQVGMFGKMGPLYFGTENLGALAFNRPRLYGTDLYIGMKINDFTFGKRDKKNNKSKNIKCPSF